MAYNPFNVFRRNQKTIFAVLTVFIMFMFVLGSGLGGGMDFFEWLPQWLGSKARKGDHLATIDGKKIYTSDVDALHRQRYMANRFMSLAAEDTQEQLMRTIRDLQPRLSEQGRMAIEALGRQDPNPLRQLATSQTAKPEDKAIARAYVLMGELGQRRGEEYFTSAPNRTQRDKLEFMVWEKKADQLGIAFTTDDVKALIQREFMGEFTSDVRVREAMSRGGQSNFSMDACLKAIAVEFKVRTAQTAILGPVSGRSDRTLTSDPIFSPPFEQFQYYRDNASPTTYQVLAVPAAAFMADVTGTPTDDEIKKLFDQYSSQEPNPGVETPGFKEGRKLKLEWLSARGDEPYYKAAAAEQMKKTHFGSLLGLVAGGPLAAAGGANLAIAEPFLDRDYKAITVQGHDRNLIIEWRSNNTNPRPLDTSLVRPETIAGAAGAAAGALSSFGFNIPASTALGNRTWAAEQRARIAVGMPVFLGGVPGPGMFATATMGEARSMLAIPKPLPMDVVRPELEKSLAEREARTFMTKELTKLQEDLNKPEMVKARDKSDAKRMLAEFAAKRGLKTGKSADGDAGFRDEWTIGDDPGLAPVKEALEKSEGGNNPHRAVSAPVQFGRQFFWQQADFRGGGSRTPTRDTYKPEFYPNTRSTPDLSPFAPPEPRFLVWRTDDKSATTVLPQVARPKVIEAWKRIKARDIAKQRAQDIASLIQRDSIPFSTAIQQDLERQKATLQDKAADPKVKERVKVFELANVAPLSPSEGFGAGFPGMLQPFMLQPTKDIPYPTQEMEKTLRDERTKPLKTAVVLTDAPKDTYYVAVVAAKTEKGESEFRQNVFTDSPFAPAKQMVLRSQMIDSGRKARDSILGLLKKEFKYVETDEQKQKLDENAKKGGDS